MKMQQREEARKLEGKEKKKAERKVMPATTQRFIRDRTRIFIKITINFYACFSIVQSLKLLLRSRSLQWEWMFFLIPNEIVGNTRGRKEKIGFKT